MDYYSLLRKYSAKALISFIAEHQDIENDITGDIFVGSIPVANTDKYPMNKMTLLGVLEDTLKFRSHKKARNTVSFDEMKELCVARNKNIFSNDLNYDSKNALGSVFSIAKNQKKLLSESTLSSNFYRDYYMLTIVDNMFIHTQQYCLNSTNFYSNLFGCDMMVTFICVLVLYEQVIKNRKYILEKPFTFYENFFIQKFGKYCIYDICSKEEFNPLRHCLIKIGHRYYIPLFGLLYNRLSHIFYWIIKDSMKNDKPTNKFPIFFGKYYEKYIESFLRYSVEDNYIKIDDQLDNKNAGKIPDFEFTKFEQKFIIECKSRLIFGNDIDEKLGSGIFRDKIVEGFAQLKNYKNNCRDAIKMLVIYETEFPLIDIYENKIKGELKLDDNYWLVTINEFEAFIELENRNDFYKVIDTRRKYFEKNKTISVSKALLANGLGKQFSHHYLQTIIDELNSKALKIIEDFGITT